MGQYYKTLIKVETADSDGRLAKIDNDCFNDWIGLKLMEHSWLGCLWADLLAWTIYKKTCRVTEIGDYADEFPLYSVAYNSQFKDILDTIDINEFAKDGEFEKFVYENKYLVNYDKKQYIDFNSYIEQCKDKYDDVASPMNLLCAQGNGRGGGDYHDSFHCFDEVGSWAWDLISIEDEVPSDFNKYEVCFKEE